MPQGARGGFPVNWRVFGHGPENALLLHCALAHSGAWRGLADHLEDVLTMTAPDMPGHGQSADWDQRYDLHDQVTAIARDCHGGKGHIVGHSFGATVALRLAVEEPSCVQSLTLIEPVLFAAARLSDPAGLKRYLAQADAWRSRDDADAARLFTSIWGDGRPWGALSERDRAGIVKRMPLIRETEPFLQHDPLDLMAEGRLARVICPVLLVRGSDSPPVIAAIHAALLERLPSAREVVIGGAGHMVPVTHAMRVAQEVRALVTGRSDAPPCNTPPATPSTA